MITLLRVNWFECWWSCSILLLCCVIHLFLLIVNFQVVLCIITVRIIFAHKYNSWDNVLRKGKQVSLIVIIILRRYWFGDFSISPDYCWDSCYNLMTKSIHFICFQAHIQSPCIHAIDFLLHYWAMSQTKLIQQLPFSFIYQLMTACHFHNLLFFNYCWVELEGTAPDYASNWRHISDWSVWSLNWHLRWWESWSSERIIRSSVLNNWEIYSLRLDHSILI